MMCKHYNTPQGCSYGDKCQFAHGPQELRSYIPNILSGDGQIDMTKNHKNLINYKIVKCKNWEKDGICKYGQHCTFAHGDNDMRTKVENYYQMQPNISMMYPMNMMDPMMMNTQMQMMNQIDPNQIQQMNQLMSGQIEPNQLMMNMNMNPNIDVNMMGIQNLNNNQNHLNPNLNQGSLDNNIQ
jgi:hypothetical protein